MPDERHPSFFPPRQGFLVMLVLLVIGSIVSAVGSLWDRDEAPLYTAILALALVAGVSASEVGAKRTRLAVGVALLIPLWEWLGSTTELEWVRQSHNAPALTLLIYTAWVSVMHVFKTERVSRDKIFGAVCVYLLLIAMFALVYRYVYDVVGEEAFDFSRGVPIPDRTMGELHYFSWVTQTTLGFGDIAPVHPLARTAASTQCILGQFYLTVVVARLVALNITQGSESDEPAEE